MSARGFRLSGGGLIDRTKPVSFRFAGRAFQGYQGDTIASALLARGEHLVARSFKYHRPRGILGAGSEDPAGLVQIGSDAAVTDPNVRATEQEIFEGLEALAQNCWPSVDFDAGAVNDLFSALLPAGFYYKTFMGPPAAWSFFEPIIRRAAGLGVGPQGPDPDRYETANRHCDVLVCGGGPAGLMAALAAARSGLRVILVEETPHLGGRFLSIDQEALRLDGQTPAAWVQSVRNELDGLEDVQILTRTCAVGYYADNFVTAWEKVADHLAPGDRDPALPRQRFWRIRAKKVVLATGSIERPIVFNGNDRPGVMLASAVRTYIHRFGVVPGRRAILFTNNDDGWQTAIDLHNAGAAIHAIIDSRRAINPPLLALAAERGIALHPGSVITATRGRKHISQVTVRSLDGDNEIGIACDLLAVSGGHSPNVALFSQSRGRLAYDDTIAGFRPGESWQNEVSVGACNGTFTTADCLAEGVAAGSPDSAAVKIPYIAGDALDGTGIAALWEVPANLSRGTARSFVDLQNDVTAKDLKLAVSEGYDSVEHAKRYTTMGMGTDQGKTSGMNAFGILAGALSISIPTLGVTTYRQPFKPVTFGALAGQHVGAHFQPRRTTPMHDWHVENGAIFEPVGDWLRPWTYPRAGESHEAAIARECRAARSRCGVVDATTLGKIDVRGPDARTFLGRIYTNAWAKLPPGQCRYGLMLGEDGMVMDDGVTACIADDHFHMTTTTGGAARVMGHLEDYLQTEWPDLRVYLTSVTEQWAVASLCGPESGRIINALFGETIEKLDFMHWSETILDGIPVRVFRVSFTGELSYEINVPAGYGLWLWKRLMEAGEPYGITPYGTEAMHVLRAEKGFIIVGQDTDGTITPIDLRMNWIVKKKGDFVGRRSLTRADTARTDRKQLVGLLTEDGEQVLKEGAHVIDTASEPAPPVPMLGHVTSSYMSPTLDRSIALALVKSGGDRIGERLYVTRPGEDPLPVTVTETDFLAELGQDDG